MSGDMPERKALIEGFQPHAQSVQPWQFGTDPNGPDNVKKRTCLWLKGLPKLVPTGTLDGSTARPEIHHASPGPDRKRRRSRFFPGLAAAMATQWAGYALEQEDGMSDWQLIETAPKDGTCVLVFPGIWSRVHVSVAYFDTDKFAKKPRPFWNRLDSYGRSTVSRETPPTHWMPLPEPLK